MKYTFFIALFLFSLNLSSQDQLKNTFSSWSEVHGGMEDGGIERSESYVFVATKTLKIKDVYFKDKEIVLNANDTLQITIHMFNPYNQPDSSKTKSFKKPEQPSQKKRFTVLKKNNTFYANVMYPYEWPKKLDYIHKKKTYAVTTKKEFDKGNSSYAP